MFENIKILLCKILTIWVGRKADKNDPHNFSKSTAQVKMLGWFPTEQTIAEAVEEVDKDATGEIDFDEFFSLIKSRG